jgi:CheY-like chemotaxis protein
MHMDNPLSLSHDNSKPQRLTSAGRSNTLGIAEPQLLKLMEVLDSLESDLCDKAANERQAKRKLARWKYRKSSTQVTIIHPGGTEVVLYLACRNLSAGGATLLHSSFVHPGSACIMMLTNLQGQRQMLSGHICRCAHRAGTVHEVGIKFRNPILLNSFIDERTVLNYHERETVNAHSLRGRVLIVSSVAETVRFLKHSLRDTQLCITVVDTKSKAMQEATEAYDLLLINGTVDDISGIQFLENLRESQCEVPALLLGANLNEVRASGVARATAMPAPYSPLQLIRRIAERMGS